MGTRKVRVAQARARADRRTLAASFSAWEDDMHARTARARLLFRGVISTSQRMLRRAMRGWQVCGVLACWLFCKQGGSLCSVQPCRTVRSWTVCISIHSTHTIVLSAHLSVCAIMHNITHTRTHAHKHTYSLTYTHPRPCVGTSRRCQLAVGLHATSFWHWLCGTMLTFCPRPWTRGRGPAPHAMSCGIELQACARAGWGAECRL